MLPGVYPTGAILASAPVGNAAVVALAADAGVAGGAAAGMSGTAKPDGPVGGPAGLGALVKPGKSFGNVNPPDGLGAADGLRSAIGPAVPVGKDFAAVDNP